MAEKTEKVAGRRRRTVKGAERTRKRMAAVQGARVAPGGPCDSVAVEVVEGEPAGAVRGGAPGCAEVVEGESAKALPAEGRELVARGALASGVERVLASAGLGVPFEAGEREQREGESTGAWRKRLSRLAAERSARQMEVWQANAAERLGVERRNPLLHLGEEQAAKLFFWLRECPYPDAVRQMLAEQGIPAVSSRELDEFFEAEASRHWMQRVTRAATEANALVRLAEEQPGKFSSGILAALGQEAFRQLASGEAEPQAMGRMVNLFIKARGDERAEELLALRREKARREELDEMEQALEVFAREVEDRPEARRALELLREELGREVE